MESKRRRGDKSIPPAEPKWDELPPDLWRCILMGLNPAQVMRWRCVSKSCRHVVDQLLLKDDFYLNQVVRASSPGIVVCTDYVDVDGDGDFGAEISYPWANNGEPGPRPLMTLEGFDPKFMPPSINGLICMIDRGRTIVLCNPTTGESLTLPLCPYPVVNTSYSGRGRYLHYCEIGFGYSPSTDEYKFVHLCLRERLWLDHTSQIRVFECRVLTLRLSSSSPHDDRHQQQQQQQQLSTSDDIDHDSSSSWRRIKHSFGYENDDGFGGINRGSVCVDGVIYWSGHTRSPPDCGEQVLLIAAFHVTDETFTTIPPPPTPALPYYCSCVTELQRRLGVGIIYREVNGSNLDVWMLMGPGNWSRQLRIDLNMGPGLDRYMLCESAVVFLCHPSEKFIVILDDAPGLIYDLNSKSFLRRSSLPPPIRFKSSPIKESFLSLQFPTCVV